MSITVRSTCFATRARRLLAGLVIGGAASALAVAVAPQMANAHTDTSTGSPGSFRYATWHPAMLAVGEKSADAGWVAQFHSDGPLVTPAGSVPHQYVVATYKLQYAAQWENGTTPRWAVVDTASETRGLADFDKAGLPGTKKLTDVTFAPKSAPRGYYRVQVQMAWYNADTDRVIGTQTSISEAATGTELVCAGANHVGCTIEPIGIKVG